MLLQSARGRYLTVGAASAVLGFLVAWPVFATGQDSKAPQSDPKHVHPADKAADPNKELVEQIKLLQAKVTRLEAVVAKIAPPAGGGMAGMGGGSGGMGGMMDMDGMMGGMGGKKKAMGGSGGGMGMTDDMMGGMGGGSGGGMAGMGGGGGGGSMMDDMDMMGMGSMGGSKGKKMKMTAALPGFPGASHIYHIGATDFFLDHPEHITLSTEQKTKLGQMKQKATTEKASAQRKIEEGEQQLWELTAADQPDAAKIEAKVREVEKLRGDQRLAFIRSVGESAQVLTDEQRKILLGQAQPAAPTPHVHPKTP
ncbi:periplasmic heavy metal sensor [bacterium]|nr:periplasmic heavy metal sensor [bacterium]